VQSLRDTDGGVRLLGYRYAVPTAQPLGLPAKIRFFEHYSRSGV
jgi:hypothetical protein